MTITIGMHCDGDPWPPGHLKAVEDFGFDVLTTGEHIVFHRPILEATTILGFAAASTTTATSRRSPRPVPPPGCSSP